MKKLIALIFALTVTLTLAACDLPETNLSGDPHETTASTEVSRPDEEQTPETPETPEAPETPVTPETPEIPETPKTPEVEEEEEEETPAPHTHSYSASVTTPATCTDEGVKTFACACGHSYTEPLAAKGHNCGDWYEYFPAIFKVNGEQRRECKNCDHFEAKIIPALTTSDDKNENFYRNETVGGSDGNVDIQLRYVYWEDGKLVAHCYIINRTQYNYDTINPMFMSIRNPETGVLCASGNFPAINKQMPAMQYVEHTFSFSGEAVDNYAADLTKLTLTIE